MNEWRTVNQKIYALVNDMKTRLKKESKRLHADKIFEKYKEHEASVLKYLDTESEIEKNRLLNTGTAVVRQINAIRDSKEKELARYHTAFEAELNDRASKIFDLKDIIKSFIASEKNEKTFILSNDIKYQDMAKKDLAKAVDLAKTLSSEFKSELNAELGQALIKSLEDYGTAFDRFVSLFLSQWETYPIMVKSAREAQNVCEEAHTDHKNKMFHEIRSSKWIIFIAAVAAMAIGFIAAFFITQSIATPIRQITDFVIKLNKGDLSERLPMGRAVNCSEILGCEDKDCSCFGKEAECWTEAGSFSMFPTCFRVIQGEHCHTCKAYKKAAPNQLEEMGLTLNAMAHTLNIKANAAMGIAGGDLDQTIRVTSKKDIIGQALRDMIEGLNDLIRQVNEAGTEVASESSQVAASSQSLSQGAAEQASSLEQASSSMIEIGSRTKANAENASRANELAGQTKKLAELGMQEMKDMIAAMANINSASQAIAKIIKVIDEIAFQTNLLSLNAAVEAARAGRHGKGFAVVAEEVRNLAGRSAKAAKETAEIIEGAVKKAEKGNEIASQTDQSLNRIMESVTKVAELINEIAASSDEQVQAIAQVNQGLGEIDQVTQQNAANAEETASAAHELAEQASYLQEILGQFKLKKTVQD